MRVLSGRYRPGYKIRRSAGGRRQRYRKKDKRFEHFNSLHSRNERYQLGYERGYKEGLQKGQASFEVPFHGTSIIIPTYQQPEYLKQCIASIEAHTPEPYEIIVVDNGSDEQTGDYLLKRAGQIRSVRMATNRGFSGGVNQGLMMAKGDTLLILNNDTLVTPGWLGNMLSCLNSDPSIGAVGPVTNYISGDQQIEVPYETVAQMWEFASSRSVPESSRWSETDRLVGFCLLFRRELLHKIGYFDEGYRIGNYEDDDWIIRLRLSGRSLFIAKDAFIHHFGSVSMKNLEPGRFQDVHSMNEQYFINKWGNPYHWVDQVKRLLSSRSLPESQAGDTVNSYDFYPSHVLIMDRASRMYWLQQGMKYRISGSIDADRLRPVLLSMMELRTIPDGTGEQHVESIFSQDTQDSTETPGEGQLVSCGDGEVYQWSRGTLRPFVSNEALRFWKLDTRPVRFLPEIKQIAPEGLPIISAPHLQSEIL